jgi:hypothetical protein
LAHPSDRYAEQIASVCPGLFTEVPSREILGSPYPESCIASLL